MGSEGQQNSVIGWFSPEMHLGAALRGLTAEVELLMADGPY